MEALAFDTLRFSYSGASRSPSDELYGGSPAAAVVPCADGFVQFQEIRPPQGLFRLLGGDDLAGDERFATEKLRLANLDALRQAYIDHLADKRRWDVFEQGGREHFVVAAVPDMADLLELAPHRERGYFYTFPDGPLAGTPVPGPPIRFGDGEWRCEPAAVLGSANREVLGDDLGLTAEDRARLRADGRL